MSDSKTGPARGRWTLTTRQKRYWGAMLIAFVLGLVTVWFLDSAQPAGSEPRQVSDLFTNVQLSARAAIIASLAFFALSAACLYLQHKGMDEQEERAYLIACTASWYVIIAAFPIWWLLSRAALIPPVQFHFILIASLIVNLTVWAWKKFV